MLLLSSCGSGGETGENPFFTEWDTPFGTPPFERIEPRHFMPAFERAMSLHDAEIDAIVTDRDEPDFANTVLAYDEAGRMLEEVRQVFGMLCSAETNPEMQALQEQVVPLLTTHADKIRMNERLFERFRSVYERRATLDLDAEQMRLLEKYYNRFVRSGALLDEAGKERLKQINAELAALGVKFGNNVLAENNAFALTLEAADLEGIPASMRDAAKEKAAELGAGADRYVFTLHKPSMLPFLTYASRRDLREKLYTAYLERGSHGDEHDNNAIINDMVRLRLEKAKLLGYPSYAQYVVSDQMAGSVDAVYGLLDSIWPYALDRAKEELAEMEKLFRKDHPGETFASWDWWYYAEKVRKQQYNLEEEMLRPYFSLENVKSGIFFLANRLYGITFRPVSLPVYHEEVVGYEVLDADNSHLGVLYFDFFPRAGKSGGAWCGNYREQSYRNGERVAPVVGIVCNFTRPTGNAPALLTLDETSTLFHEFGHALHFLFHDVKYRGLSGVEGDFVELPSQIMENWAFEPQMLRQYATHYRTDEVIPDHLIEKMNRSRYFNQGFVTTELLAAALSDMDVHAMTDYAPFDARQLTVERLFEGRGLIPQIEPRYRYPYFSHIFDGGYSAGYYFYIWAEVLDKDAFGHFKAGGDLFDSRLAGRFRAKLLSRGGSADGMTLYRDFCGADPDKTALLVARGLIPEPEPEPEPAPETATETSEVRE